MQLRVNSRYSTQTVSYAAGDTIDVTDAEAERLMADSPGTFAALGVPAPVVADVPEMDAISTETATAIKAPDRRARGGKVR